MNKAKVKSARKSFGDHEAVEAGCQKYARFVFIRDDDEHGKGSQVEESGSEDGGSGVLRDAKNVDEAKNRLERFRVEERPVFLLRLMIQRYAPGNDDIVIDPCYGTGSTGVAAFLENKSFYGMDEDILATIVAERYLKHTMKKANAKSAGKAFGDPEAVEAGVKRTQEGSQVKMKMKNEDEVGSQVDESGNEDGDTPEANDRWYFGDVENDEGRHV
jgi:hypothetical protein